jgi:hypothetical protein
LANEHAAHATVQDLANCRQTALPRQLTIDFYVAEFILEEDDAVAAGQLGEKRQDYRRLSGAEKACKDGYWDL